MKKKTLMILLGIMIISVSISSIHYDRKSYDKNIIDVTVKNIEEKDIVQKLKETYNNNEIVGYLKIDNTDLKVPITQGENNSKYLSKDAYGNDDTIGNPFLDYRVDINSSNKLLIYGHNLAYGYSLNNKDVPFKILENYYDKEFYDSHKYIELITDSNIFKYEIYSVYVETEDWSYMKIDYPNSDSRYNELRQHKSKSFYDTGVDITPTDEILILQTCSSIEEYSQYNKSYLLVVSRKVEK